MWYLTLYKDHIHGFNMKWQQRVNYVYFLFTTKVQKVTLLNIYSVLNQGKDGTKGETGSPGLPGTQVLVTPEVRRTTGKYLMQSKM